MKPQIEDINILAELNEVNAFYLSGYQIPITGKGKEKQTQSAQYDTSRNTG